MLRSRVLPAVEAAIGWTQARDPQGETIGDRVRHMKVITLGFACVVVVMLVLVSGCTGDQSETTSEASASTVSTESVTATSPDATSASLATTVTAPSPPPITAQDIKTLAPSYSAFTPDEIQVVDSETFGDWAVAYVTADGAETPVVIFTREANGWTVFDIGTGIGPDDLRSEGVPEDVIEWAFPSGP